MFSHTTALCDSFLEMGIPGLDLMVCQDGQCVLRYIKGYSDRERQIPMRGDELYNIFSCSKLFTIIAAMQLWEKGLFKLEDRLSDYLPEYAHVTVKTEDGPRPAQRPILIRNLFQMTAGFSYDLTSPALLQLQKDTGGRCPTREVARALAGEPLQFEPGDHYRYSLCHDVLAALVEVLSGQLFADYVKEHIFDPLGMPHSDFLPPMERYDSVIPLYLNDAASGQIILRPRGKVPAYRLGTEHASGGAGAVSTVEDYMKFLEALRLGDILISRDTLRLMLTTQLSNAQLADFYYLHDYSYGLGLRVPRPDNKRSDFGWGGAAGAYCITDPVHGFSLYYAQHVLRAPNRSMRQHLTTSVLADLFGIQTDSEPAQTADGAPVLY